MSENKLRDRIRRMSTRARIIVAILIAVFLLLVGAGCAIFGLLMMAFSTDACSSLPAAMDYYLFLPPALLLLGSLLPALLFALRRSLTWVLGSLLLCYVLAAITFVGWFGLVIAAC